MSGAISDSDRDIVKSAEQRYSDDSVCVCVCVCVCVHQCVRACVCEGCSQAPSMKDIWWGSDVDGGASK